MTGDGDRSLRVDQFDFDLPEERIAQRPARPRDSARLLVVADGERRDLRVRDLPGLLRPGDVVVVNDTEVIPARLVGSRGAARVEVTLHKRVRDGLWKAFARPAKRLRPGDRLTFADGFGAEVVDKGAEGEVTLSFDGAPEALFAALDRHGIMPLPPYIKRPREGDAADRGDYQTLFACNKGAVAAPTAGLHFTPELITAIEATGAAVVRLTLHVGAGTFLPVRVERVRDHRMHAEWGEITESACGRINQARADCGRVVAVGTTSLRLLESAAMDDGTLRPFADETDIFITPGYRFRIVDCLVTNFHLPRSTLFMLVCAFSGMETMRAAYAHAVEAGYRFYSYGDACFLERTP